MAAIGVVVDEVLELALDVGDVIRGPDTYAAALFMPLLLYLVSTASASLPVPNGMLPSLLRMQSTTNSETQLMFRS